MNRLLASIAAVFLCVARTMTQDAAAEVRLPRVESATQSAVVDKVEVGEDFRQALDVDPPYSPPVVRPKNRENRFVFVYVTAEFPRGRSWTLSDFSLRDDKKREYQVVAFDIGDVLGHSLIHRIEDGALAIADAERARQGIADRLQDRTGRMKSEAGRVKFLGEWPGGRGKLVLGFEVPVVTTRLTLLRKGDDGKGVKDGKGIRNGS